MVLTEYFTISHLDNCKRFLLDLLVFSPTSWDWSFTVPMRLLKCKLDCFVLWYIFFYISTESSLSHACEALYYLTLCISPAFLSLYNTLHLVLQSPWTLWNFLSIRVSFMSLLPLWSLIMNTFYLFSQKKLPLSIILSKKFPNLLFLSWQKFVSPACVSFVELSGYFLFSIYVVTLLFCSLAWFPLLIMVPLQTRFMFFIFVTLYLPAYWRCQRCNL